MSGICIAGILSIFLPLSVPDQLALTVVGMSACLGSVVRAPVTGILIVFEMTHEFSLVPALMIGALVSEVISRRLNDQNFYDALIEQDGHHIEHVKPPRDLQSWHQFPVSAVANFRPVLAESTEREQVTGLLEKNPYQRFPVVKDGVLQGILTRNEALAAIAEGRNPKLEPATECYPDQNVRQLQMLLIESSSQMVVLMDSPNGKLLGVVTLHDLLRAEVSVSKNSE